MKGDSAVAQQVVSFGKAVVGHVKAKRRHATERQYQERLAICKACDYWAKHRCKLCGCWKALKLRWATSECPDKPPRWTAVKEQ